MLNTLFVILLCPNPKQPYYELEFPVFKRKQKQVQYTFAEEDYQNALIQCGYRKEK